METRTSRKGSKKRRSGAGTVVKVLLTMLLIALCTALMLGAIFMKYVNTTLTPVLGVKAEDYKMKLSSVVYYQDSESGEWIEYQKVHGTENRIWADIEQMPPALWQATVSIEDERFFQHKGVDWKRTLGATLTMFLGGNDSYGGSTITQQLLKNITQDNKNTVNRKVREIFRALEFEKNYTKSQILELYLNTIYLGKGCYGVQTAAEYYFGKDVSELSVAECASLIAITNNPSLYGPMYNVTYTRADGTTVTPRQLNKQRQE
ncbi:MAG: transglycosylase domain-containing protein, partial [Oscillibacter sp.]|nr:transglycosylase domain-containing protein [Oscillibacter sp.]